MDEQTTYFWSYRQKRGRDGVWRDALTLYRDGTRTRFVFHAGEAGSGRYTSEGGYWMEGCLADGRGNLLNLREPGVVRALVDEAGRRGLLTGAGELDGWELFRAVVVSRSAAATAGVPPGSPPGP
ncbi:hypothetical protein C4B68_27045 [Streptomyces dengpaensis]|uniref:Uncharacterized protein n=1 Tax=Streptomyces dengpaensis TaxID=2049881 RepID=A0ABM6T3E5_9ACTN|nr:hypothetical protein C4B68_27045 [Streptomyces dengpaensis]PIB11418.1 hypothetical protein B1C81_04600 [Streptomyces sp. HG99]